MIRRKIVPAWGFAALAGVAALLAPAALLATAALAVAPRPAAAAENIGVTTGSDLMKLCDDPGDNGRIACKFFVLGALQAAGLMHAADTHEPKALLYCASDSTTNGDLIKAIRGLVQIHPERLNYPAASVVVGGAMEAYPCARAPATMLRRAPVKRAVRPGAKAQ